MMMGFAALHFPMLWDINGETYSFRRYCTFIPTLLLLMTHHEEMGLNANCNPNPNGVWKCNRALISQMIKYTIGWELDRKKMFPVAS